MTCQVVELMANEHEDCSAAKAATVKIHDETENRLLTMEIVRVESMNSGQSACITEIGAELPTNVLSAEELRETSPASLKRPSLPRGTQTTSAVLRMRL